MNLLKKIDIEEDHAVCFQFVHVRVYECALCNDFLLTDCKLNTYTRLQLGVW